MDENPKSVSEFLLENEDLRNRLREAEETLSAIHSGEVDAIVVSPTGSEKERIFTLVSAETPYRVFVEQMNEGALTLSTEGVIVYCNQRFSKLISLAPENILGRYFSEFVVKEDIQNFKKLLKKGQKDKSSGEIRCLTGDNRNWNTE